MKIFIHTPSYKLKILILGGTQFVGRLIAEEAVVRGHDVTLFNRGNDAAPKGVTKIVGDRLEAGGYSGLDGLFFDAVIDTWARDPIAVKTAVDALRGRIRHYVYISSVSVYDFKRSSAPYDEWTPLADPEEEIHSQYTKDKVRGEQAASQAGVPTTFIRAGVILGPYETVWRLPWWLLRMKRGGETLAPGPKDLAMQFVDVRDLANFTVDAVEKKIDGAFNIVSERNHISYGKYLEAANKVTGQHAELHWLEPEQVLEAGIGQFNELPLWLPPSADHSVFSIAVSKAVKVGLQIRDARETIVDTWAWVKTVDEVPSGISVGLDPGKEREALKKHERMKQ